MATIKHNGKLVHLTQVGKREATAMVDTVACLQLKLDTPYVMAMNHVFLPLNAERISEIDCLEPYEYKGKPAEEVDEPLTVTWTYGSDEAIISFNGETDSHHVEYVGINCGNLGINLEFFCRQLEELNASEYELFVKTKVKLNREE